ncbi:MAG: ABC transporter ATP-binding protein [candidate division Zixibacteria bacterium]|nr:ABC transporter ATP-binding protein [candidate division Zixibacteria bacterium]
MMKYIKWFWKYYKNHKRALAVLLIFSIFSAMLLTIQPLLLKNIFDLVKSGETTTVSLPYVNELIERLGGNDIGNYVLMLVGFAFLWFLVYVILVGHRAYMNVRLEMEFRQECFDAVTTKGPDFFNKFTTGDLVTRMTDDVGHDKLAWFACSGIFRFYESVILILFSLVMMLSIHPMLTLWTTLPLPVLVFIYIKSSTVLDKRFDFLQKKISKVNDTMEACFSGIRVIKSYVKEKDQRMRFANVADKRQTAEISAVKAHTVIESLWMYIWQIGIVIILLGGGYYIINGTLTIGEFVAFDSFVLFMIYPMFDVGNFLVKGLRAAVSIKRLVEIENHEPMVVNNNDGKKINGDGPEGRVTFENVHFRFPGMERDILDSLNFTAEPGERVALVGKVGSGKSWAARLIPQLVNPTEGKVTLDGCDLREYDVRNLRRHIGYVPQEPILFSDTMENNIRFGRDDISDETLNWAIDVAQLRPDLNGFPDGLKTMIGVRGMSISGGQKQRLGLARALVGQPKILILDDCTSALDADTEALLWDGLHEVMPDLTCFIVSHRPATLEKADKIVVLDEGKIVEEGGHIDLILKEGLYCKLYHRIMLEEAVGSPKPDKTMKNKNGKKTE